MVTASRVAGADEEGFKRGVRMIAGRR